MYIYYLEKQKKIIIVKTSFVIRFLEILNFSSFPISYVTFQPYFCVRKNRTDSSARTSVCKKIRRKISKSEIPHSFPWGAKGYDTLGIRSHILRAFRLFDDVAEEPAEIVFTLPSTPQTIPPTHHSTYRHRPSTATRGMFNFIRRFTVNRVCAFASNHRTAANFN